MDQGVHQLRLLVTVGDAAAVRRCLPGLADWLSCPPAVYSHLPIGQRGDGPEPERHSLLRLTPASLRLLACKPAEQGQAVILRLQEVAGQGAEGELELDFMRVPARLKFTPYEIKTLRIESDGVWQEVGLTSEQS